MKKIVILICSLLWMACGNSYLLAMHVRVTVQVAGQLSSMVKDMECDSITISGTLDENDFSFLKGNLLNLSYVDIKETSLPENKIPSWALSNKNSLQEVILPKNLEIIGEYAFNECINLKKVVFPNVLKEIRTLSFSNCPLSKGVELPKTVTLIDYGAFKNLQVNEIVLPDSLQLIGPYAFAGSNLSKIVFPDHLEEIKEYAFEKCTQLQQAVFPACVETIKDYAFSGCYRLRTASFKGSVPPVIFGNTFNYTNIFYVPQGTVETYRKAPYWSDKVFIDEVKKVTVSLKTAGTLGEEILKQVDYVSDVNELTINGPLNEDDFYQIQHRTTNLIRIDMTGVIVETLPEDCFKNRVLLDIKLPATLKRIGSNAFYGCYNLTQMEIPEGVTGIDWGAFYNCYSIKTVKLPATLTEIGSAVFYYCRSLEKIELPDSLSEIPSDAFYGCEELCTVKFPADLKLISGSAFNSCKSLEEIILPERLSEIQYNAFRGCSSLTSVTLPASLTFCDIPFYECTNIKKIICLASVPPILDNDLNILGDVDKTDIELLVPFWSLDAYKLTKGWDAFPVILPLDYETDYIFVPGKLVIAEDVRFTNNPTVYVAKDGKLTVRGTDALSMRKYIQSYVLNGNTDNWGYQDAVYTSLLSESGAMRADSVEYQLDLYKNYWQFIALPFDVNMADIELDNDAQFVIRYYDGESRAEGENSNWKDMPADGVLQAGTGYIVQVSKPVRMTLKAVNNGNKNRLFSGSSLKQLLYEYPSEFAHNASWNLLGNPYPCHFDIKYLGCTAPITVWDSYNRTYTAIFAEDDDYILNPMQAFFIQKPVGTDEIIFEADGRQLDTTVRQRAAAGDDDFSSDRTVFNFSLSDGTYTDRTRVVVNPKKSMEYELVCDAAKFMSDNSMVPQLFTLDTKGRRYAINERPLGDGTVAVGCYAGATGMYTLSLVNVPQAADEVVLIDKQTGCETHLEQDTYTFTAEAGLYLNRFELRLKTHGATGTADCLKSSAVQVTSADGKITVMAQPGDELVVYGANGQLVVRQILTQNTTDLPMASGFYLVCIGADTFKIMVNQ